MSDPIMVSIIAGIVVLVLLKKFAPQLTAMLTRLLIAGWAAIGRYVILGFFASIILGLATLIARVKFRRLRRESLRQVEIILSRDDSADPHQVAALLTAIYHQLRVRRPILGFITGDWTRFWLGTDHCAWEMTKGPDKVIRFRVVAPEPQMQAILGRLHGVWENIRFGPVQPLNTALEEQLHIYQMRMVRGNHYLYTIKTMKDYNNSIVEALAAAWNKEPGTVTLQFILRPMPLTAYRRLKKQQMHFQEKYLAMENTDPNHPGIGYVQDKELKASMESIGHGLFTVEIRVIATSLDLVRATVGGLGEAAGANAFVEVRVWYLLKQWRYWFSNRMTTLLAPFPTLMLSSAHLATLIHLPSVRLRGIPFNRIPLRRALASDRIERDPNRPVLTDEVGPVSLTEDSRKYGVLILGVQGQGKSTLMIMLIYGDIQSRSKAIFVIDPKSDLARDVLGIVPPDMPLWYMDFSNPQNDVSIPLFRYASSPDVIADNIISALQSAFGSDAIGPRSDSLLRNSVYAVYEVEGPKATLWEVYRMLADADYRKQVARAVKTPFQKGFWKKQIELAENNAKLFEEMCAAPRNKLERILAVKPLYTAFVGGKRAVDLQAVIQQRGILLVNLAKATIGEGNASFAGSLILATIWQAIQTQAQQAQANRDSVAVHVDEAHNLANKSTAVMLAEGRAFGLQATFAHQHREQISDPDARSAFESLLQNRAIFRTEALVDAEYFAKVGARVHTQLLGVSQDTQVRLTLGADDMMEMPRYHLAARLVINGEPQPLFVGKTIDHTKFLNSEWREQNLLRTAPQHPAAQPPIEAMTAGEEDGHEVAEPDELPEMEEEAASPGPADTQPADQAEVAAAVEVAVEASSGSATVWENLSTMYGLNDFGGGPALQALATESGASFVEVQSALQEISTRPPGRGKKLSTMDALRQRLLPDSQPPKPRRRKKAEPEESSEGPT